MRWTALWVGSLLLLGSCIRDTIPPCPPLSVILEVKDKNYFNIRQAAGLEEEKDENLAFREYVPTLHYLLRNVSSGKVVQEQELLVDHDRSVFEVVFPENLPHGQYVFTAWGNIDSVGILQQLNDSTRLHWDHDPMFDVYVVTDTLEYSAYDYQYRLGLERIKGKLLILAEHFPPAIDYSVKQVDRISSHVTSGLEYGGSTYVETETYWTDSIDILTRTVLAPTPEGSTSILEATLYDRGGVDPSLTIDLPKTQVTMKRNELTIVRFVYQTASDIEVYLWMDGNWERIPDLEIE